MKTPTQPNLEELRLQAVRIAREAGQAILRIYRAENEADQRFVLKDDASPLTQADLASHQHITEALRALTPALKILSEESANDAPYPVRRSWTRFWLVDPLDGTKEFLKHNGEFTVNIALIDGGRPVLGVVHAPVLDLTYSAVDGSPATRSARGGPFERIDTATPANDVLTVVASRSHAGAETQRFLDALRDRGPIDVISRGSALKICQVADGTAHLYPRLGPTMEWDTAAAHAVAAQAGAHLVALDGSPLAYNKADLHNPPFLVSALEPGPYLELLGYG